MSEQCWRAGVCALLSDYVCVEASVYVFAMRAGSVLLVACVCWMVVLQQAWGCLRPPLIVEESKLELNRPPDKKKGKEAKGSEQRSRPSRV